MWAWCHLRPCQCGACHAPALGWDTETSTSGERASSQGPAASEGRCTLSQASPPGPVRQRPVSRSAAVLTQCLPFVWLVAPESGQWVSGWGGVPWPLASGVSGSCETSGAWCRPGQVSPGLRAVRVSREQVSSPEQGRVLPGGAGAASPPAQKGPGQAHRCVSERRRRQNEMKSASWSGF